MDHHSMSPLSLWLSDTKIPSQKEPMIDAVTARTQTLSVLDRIPSVHPAQLQTRDGHLHKELYSPQLPRLKSIIHTDDTNHVGGRVNMDVPINLAKAGDKVANFDHMGLLLATFSFVVNSVELYSRSAQDAKHLLESLRNNEQSFRHSVEFLLRATVSPEERKLLLDDPFAELWRQSSVQQQVSQRLGHQTQSLFERIGNIRVIIDRLTLKLPAPTNDRFRKTFKDFLHTSSCAVSLERLSMYNREFRNFTQGLSTPESSDSGPSGSALVSEQPNDTTMPTWPALSQLASQDEMQNGMESWSDMSDSWANSSVDSLVNPWDGNEASQAQKRSVTFRYKDATSVGVISSQKLNQEDFVESAQHSKVLTPTPISSLSLRLEPSSAELSLDSTSTARIPPKSSGTSVTSAIYNQPAIYPLNATELLKFEEDLNSMSKKWSKSEQEVRRRLVQFRWEQYGKELILSFEPVTKAEYFSNRRCVSCIRWEEKQECYVSSVDMISLLERVLVTHLTEEGRDRIRRDLEDFTSLQVSKSKAETKQFYELIRRLPKPQPITLLNAKVYPWRTLATVLDKIIKNHHATYRYIPSRLDLPASSTIDYLSRASLARPSSISDPNLTSTRAPSTHTQGGSEAAIARPPASPRMESNEIDAEGAPISDGHFAHDDDTKHRRSSHAESERPGKLKVLEVAPKPRSGIPHHSKIEEQVSLSKLDTSPTKLTGGDNEPAKEIWSLETTVKPDGPLAPDVQKTPSNQYEHIRRNITSRLAHIKSRVDAMMLTTRPATSSDSSSSSTGSKFSQTESEQDDDQSRGRTRSYSVPPGVYSLCPNPHGRARSVPRSNCFAASTLAGNQAGHGTTPGNSGYVGGSNNPRRSATNDGTERMLGNGESESSSGSGQQIKRRRKGGSGDDDEDEGGSLPCIFRVAEPGIHRKCGKKYRYISQLQRHLQSSAHMWYACEKCFATFANPTELSQHRVESMCVKRCQVPSCRRYCDRLSVSTNPQCVCVTSPLEQWSCLFRLRFPRLPVPPIDQQPSIPPPPAPRFEAREQNEIQPDFTAFEGWDEFVNMDFVNSSSSAVMNGDTVFPTTEAIEPLQPQLPLVSDAFLGQQNRTILDLEKKVALLEQRLEQPSNEQRKLERAKHVLGMLWEAFDGQEWHKARPGSRLHRMVSEIVPGVIQTSPPPNPAPPVPEQMDIYDVVQRSSLQSAFSGGGNKGDMNSFHGVGDSAYGSSGSK